MAVAAASVLFRDRRAPGHSVASGVVLLAWLAGQVLIIPFNWQQPMYAALALLIIGLGWRLRGQGRLTTAARER